MTTDANHAGQHLLEAFHDALGLLFLDKSEYRIQEDDGEQGDGNVDRPASGIQPLRENGQQTTNDEQDGKEVFELA